MKVLNLPVISINSLTLELNYINIKTRVKFDGSYLKRDKVTFTHKQVLNIYIVYEVNLWPLNVSENFALRNSLFGAVKLIKYADPD